MTPTRTRPATLKRFEILALVLLNAGCTTFARESSAAAGDVSCRLSFGASSKGSSDVSTDNPAQQQAWTVAGAALLLASVAGLAVSMYFIERRAGAPLDDGMQARSWLNANRRQLQQDLALGAGPALDDLAQAAQISLAHRPRFAQLLRTHRRELLEPLGEDVSLATAQRVMRRMGELTLRDQTLRADAEAWLARQP